MIQDIQPKRLYNEFKNQEPKDTDFVCVFHKNEILVRKTGQEKRAMPTVKEIMSQKKERKLQYLFSIDDKPFYLLQENMAAFGDYEYIPVREMRNVLDKEVCFAANTAYHLHVWYASSQYCGRCGAKTLHDTKERMMKCPECGNMIFPKVAPAVIVALTDGNRIMMTKYAGRDYKKYALLAGFCEIGETAEETVAREVMEEIGVKVKNIRYYKSQPWGVDSNLLLGYFAQLDGSSKIQMDKEELATAQWFEREEMPAKDDGISLTREMMGLFAKKEEYTKFMEQTCYNKTR